MSQSHVPDVDVRRRRWGLVAGVSTAVIGTVLAYVAEWLDPSGEAVWGRVLFWGFWVAPPLLAVLLLAFPRTRSVAAGLALGLAVTWMVSVPTCVVVAAGTVPHSLG
jgi:hypothetical protein